MRVEKDQKMAVKAIHLVSNKSEEVPLKGNLVFSPLISLSGSKTLAVKYEVDTRARFRTFMPST